MHKVEHLVRLFRLVRRTKNKIEHVIRVAPQFFFYHLLVGPVNALGVESKLFRGVFKTDRQCGISMIVGFRSEKRDSQEKYRNLAKRV